MELCIYFLKYKEKTMKFFIKLEKQNSNMVRYFAVGEHDSQNKFTGIVYGYEGGGEFSDAFIYKNKFLPSYFEDKPIEWASN